MKTKTKFSLSKNTFKTRIQLVLLGVVLFYFYDKCLIGQIRCFLEMINLKGIEQLFVEIFLPFRLLINVSNIFSVAFIALEIALAIAIIPLIVRFINRLISKIEFKQKIKKQTTSTYSCINNQNSYIIQQRFLC